MMLISVMAFKELAEHQRFPLPITTTTEGKLIFCELNTYTVYSLRAALMAQSVERWTLTRGASVRFPAVADGVVVLSKPLMHSCFGSLSR